MESGLGNKMTTTAKLANSLLLWNTQSLFQTPMILLQKTKQIRQMTFPLCETVVCITLKLAIS